jgi:hypothetical protein
MKDLKHPNAKKWALVIWILAVMMVLITFSPLILSPGRKEPAIFSLPFTLWTSMSSTFLLVLLAYLSSRIRDKL